MSEQMPPIALAELPALDLAERSRLPQTAAIYFVLAGDEVLYIGQATSLWGRWKGHHRLTQLNAYGSCRIAWLHVDDRALLDELEQACIAYFHPVLNGRPGNMVMLTLSDDLMERLQTEAQRRTLRPATAARLLIKERLDELAARAATAPAALAPEQEEHQ